MRAARGRRAGLLVALAAGVLASSALAAAPAAVTGRSGNRGDTYVTLSGTVNPGGQATTYRFQYGTTTAYGRATPALDAGSGSGPAPVQADLSGLRAGTTYHYRLVATNASGPARGADATFATKPSETPPVVVRALRIAPAAFRTAARVAFSLPTAARVRFAVQRALPRGRWRAVPGTFVRSGRAGANAFSFAGRVRGRRLGAGAYRLAAQALDATGTPGPRLAVRFRILR
ncbi:MAG: hypothetical protein QOE65_821 [Solirubrobacteraceae bacterium]|nr:hypothetical protein [Solirubrobacteraceae bacterium]